MPKEGKPYTRCQELGRKLKLLISKLQVFSDPHISANVARAELSAAIEGQELLLFLSARSMDGSLSRNYSQLVNYYDMRYVYKAITTQDKLTYIL
jgi:hypothetical protein